jgi:hypothetical protein
MGVPPLMDTLVGVIAGPLACGKFCTNGASTPLEPLLSLVTFAELKFATQTLPD